LNAVDIKPLKRFACERLSKSSFLRRILLSESENLTIPEFLAKMDLWLKLFGMERGDVATQMVETFSHADPAGSETGYSALKAEETKS